ncbi:MAG TPA: hypothetical protein VGW58_17480 [Pyrinomonadaceae bacterium]|nr:hypothetical protein [Pyrinomonadaceae bacterium]
MRTLLADYRELKRRKKRGDKYSDSNQPSEPIKAVMAIVGTTARNA